MTRVICMIIASVLLYTATSFAGDKSYTFSWTANTEEVDGYRLYYKRCGTAGPPFDGTDADGGPSPIDVGNNTTYTIEGLDDETTYHFALTAYLGDEESDFTDVVTVYPDSGCDEEEDEEMQIPSGLRVIQ